MNLNDILTAYQNAQADRLADTLCLCAFFCALAVGIAVFVCKRNNNQPK